MSWRTHSLARALLALLAAASTPLLAVRPDASAPDRAEGRPYIVVLKSAAERARFARPGADRSVSAAAEELALRHGGRVEKLWEDALEGFVVNLSPSAAARLAASPLVKHVERDLPLSAPTVDCGSLCFGGGLDQNTRPLPTSPQTITCTDPDPGSLATCIDDWGLDRIDQPNLPRDGVYRFTKTGAGVHAYVIDTGIATAHREFVGRIGSGINTATADRPNDLEDCLCNSHGTFVSSVLGGGTYGVAKNVTLHPVKVFEACGSFSGSLSTVIAGINWIAQTYNPAMGPAVASWSGGNTSEYTASAALRTAVRGVIARGISFVQAAGNQNNDACGYSLGNDEPLGINDVIIAGAINEVREYGLHNGRWIRTPADTYYQSLCIQQRDCGSNYGRCVDIWAPGAYVTGAAKASGQNGGFCQLSGTSMAAPHVAGVIAQYLQQNPTATPSQVKAAIVALGRTGVLDTIPGSPYHIKSGSPNLLLQALP